MTANPRNNEVSGFLGENRSKFWFADNTLTKQKIYHSARFEDAG